MRRQFLTFCLYLFGIFWALSILGCAPVSLKDLHALHPPAHTYEVCRAPLKAPPGTRFFAYRRSIDRIWWDADLDSLKAFIKNGVDGIYEVVPEAPAETANHLPPPYDGLKCGSTPITSTNEHRGPPSIVVAIDDELFAELVDDIAAAKKASCDIQEDT